jgi:hypothetical protein
MGSADDALLRGVVVSICEEKFRLVGVCLSAHFKHRQHMWETRACIVSSIKGQGCRDSAMGGRWSLCRGVSGQKTVNLSFRPHVIATQSSRTIFCGRTIFRGRTFLSPHQKPVSSW